MPGIFINYRRDDAPGVAGRLYDHLARSFPRGWRVSLSQPPRPDAQPVVVVPHVEIRRAQRDTDDEDRCRRPLPDRDAAPPGGRRRPDSLRFRRQERPAGFRARAFGGSPRLQGRAHPAERVELVAANRALAKVRVKFGSLVWTIPCGRRFT